MYKVIGRCGLRENMRVKFSKIWLGGPQSQGVAKFQKLLRWIDRGYRDVFNGVKIFALRSAKLKINGVKLLLSKKY